MKRGLTLPLLLCAAMLIMCFSACGSTDSTTTAEDQAEQTAEETTGAPDAEADVSASDTEDAPMDETTDDESISTVEDVLDESESNENSSFEEDVSITYPLTEETVTLTMWCEQPSLGPLRMFGGDYGVDVFEDYASIQYAAEKTGVTVSFENANSEEASTLFSLHVAAGDWADMLAGVDMYYPGGLSSAYNEDVIIDITEYLETICPDYTAIIDADEDLLKSTKDDDGHTLQIYSLLGSFMQSEGTVIRTDWLEQVNMDVPTTIDELHEVLVAFQTEIGCENPFYFNSACNQLLTSYNMVYYQDLSSNDLAIYQKDGTVYTSFTSEEYHAWLTTMQQWYTEGLIDPDFISVSSTNMGGHDEELLQADNIGVWWGNANSISNYYVMCPSEDFDVVGIYISADGEGVNHSTSISCLFGGSGGSNGVAISSTCENIELALGWLNFWYSDEGILLCNYGVEGDSYELVDGEVQYTEAVTNNSYGLDPAVALKLYSIAGGAFGIQLDERTFPFYMDQQVAAVEAWTAVCDGAWAYPATTMTTDESSVIASKSGDICTYIAESIPRFIMGELNLDSDWDSFVATVESMGMGECLAVYQSALDRYNAR